jgi:hypothetical protein
VSETTKPRTVSGANSLRGISAGFRRVSAKPIRRKPGAGGFTGTPDIVDDSDAPASGKGISGISGISAAPFRIVASTAGIPSPASTVRPARPP